MKLILKNYIHRSNIIYIQITQIMKSNLREKSLKTLYFIFIDNYYIVINIYNNLIKRNNQKYIYLIANILYKNSKKELKDFKD